MLDGTGGCPEPSRIAALRVHEQTHFWPQDAIRSQPTYQHGRRPHRLANETKQIKAMEKGNILGPKRKTGGLQRYNHGAADGHKGPPSTHGCHPLGGERGDGGRGGKTRPRRGMPKMASNQPAAKTQQEQQNTKQQRKRRAALLELEDATYMCVHRHTFAYMYTRVHIYTYAYIDMLRVFYLTASSSQI